jgi:hypothetical protein
MLESNRRKGIVQMKSFDELKDEVFRKLSQHPKIEAFFKASFAERIKLNDNWIENAIVHNILNDSFGEDHPLTSLIDAIYADKRNFEILKSKLTPRDDYDGKMHDVLAELNGYYQLRKSGFERIEALEEDIKQKTPDFSAELEGKKYLFEVKNLRSPFDIQDTLFDKCFARRFRYPNDYSRLNISFVASRTWQDVQFKPEEPWRELFDKTMFWLYNIFETIESSNNPVSERLLHLEDKFRGRVLKIECELEESDEFGILFMFDKAVKISSPLIRKSFLFPFTKRIIEKVGDALEQLLEFDTDDTCRKYILINWQKRGDLAMFYEKEGLTILGSFNHLVKNVSENLFVKLLNYDSLP